MREPEWTAENVNRKKGDTTFKFCGWCEHRASGSYRHDCMLDGGCSLLRHYRNDTQFDTPCVIKRLGGADIADIIASKEREITEAEGGIDRKKTEISILESLPEAGSKQPPLADSRNYDHFNIGDEIRVFHNNSWRYGVATNGYRHHDGCVSYVLDDFPETKDGPWGCGMAHPCVMKQEEMDYFLENGLSAFRQWLDFQDREYNGERLPIPEYTRAFVELME